MGAQAYNIITSFPDFTVESFDIETYNRQFKESNIIIRADSRQVSYAEHWGPLSIKCAFNGKEFYDVQKCRYAVTDKNYLVINNGNYYSSFIDSDKKVQSFTINFAPAFVQQAIGSLHKSNEGILDNFGNNDRASEPEFHEKLSRHDDTVSPIIFRLLPLADNFQNNVNKVEELYTLLLERLLLKQQEIQPEIEAIDSVKSSTKKELYKRLMRAKDYIDSCYSEELSLEYLAEVCCLNQFYLLRHFKSYFKITPRQYIIKKRMEAASQLLVEAAPFSVAEICVLVGYNDPSSFSKLFKQFYCHSPEEYARLNQGRTKRHGEN